MVKGAFQRFEGDRHFMLWVEGDAIYVVAGERWDRFVGGGQAAPNDPRQQQVPLVSGFGYTWERTAKEGGVTTVGSVLGWPTRPEVPVTVNVSQDSEKVTLKVNNNTHYLSKLHMGLLEPDPEPEPEPEPEPIPTPDPGDLPKLEEQANYDMILLPTAKDPRLMVNLGWFLWVNPQSNGTVVGQTVVPPVFLDGVEFPDDVKVIEKDGKWFMWFANEFATGLWNHILRVAYRPFIPGVDTP